MLLELRAENYAVIDHAVASFGPGLNLLTGETGAGKSILVDALALLLGGKASSDVVRHGAEKAVVSCVFDTTAGAEVILEANGIDLEGSEILLRRELSSAGKGRVFINNQPATVNVLRQLAPELALVHAQSETLSSFDQAQQRGLLDRFAGINCAASLNDDIKQKVRNKKNLTPEEIGETVWVAHRIWRDARAELERLSSDEQERLRMADVWSFQQTEIADAAITSAAEDEELEAEKRILANAEKLYTASMSAHELLYESEKSAETTITAALRHLEELARYEPKFAEAASQIASAKAAVEDVAATVRDYAENINASPARLEQIEDRLALLDKLKRKYGKSLADVLAYAEDIAQKLEAIRDHATSLASAQRAVTEAEETYRTVAEDLTQLRTAAAERLQSLAEQQINDLAMKVRFQVVVTPQPEPQHWTSAGWDTIACLIATNTGEPLKPLDEIASGGEMSRVMLALKVSVEDGAGKKRKIALPRTLVFDEIDIGIGGRAAEAVGQKLKALAQHQQVLCVTHLPQIAAFGDQHFLIEKSESQGRTRTQIRQMDLDERTQEIARMLSGATLTDTSLRHAEQMLKASQ
jgi:DNA repair protein RecN (Recombination protein N)